MSLRLNNFSEGKYFKAFQWRHPTTHAIAAWLDCKTVRIFAYSGTREQSNKRSGTRLKTERRLGHARKTLTPRFTDFFADFEKKNSTVLQSILRDQQLKSYIRMLSLQTIFVLWLLNWHKHFYKLKQLNKHGTMGQEVVTAVTDRLYQGRRLSPYFRLGRGTKESHWRDMKAT